MHYISYFFFFLVLALIIMICSIFGLPWFVAATVMSINHIQACSDFFILAKNKNQHAFQLKSVSLKHLDYIILSKTFIGSSFIFLFLLYISPLLDLECNITLAFKTYLAWNLENFRYIVTLTGWMKKNVIITFYEVTKNSV